ncbi:Hypothetical protein D9617_9g025880 [Elsinoe fawcettii]|nr:Hypothetical protein D9617_9g025880 [Elsinoe fawcettii]
MPPVCERNVNFQISFLTFFMNRIMSFYILPAEIRSQILGYALISPHPIIVWSSQTHTRHHPKHQWTTHIDHSATIKSLSSIAFSLNRVDRLVSEESLKIFYATNTFLFLGVEEYLPVISWLHCLGPLNRSYLKRLVLMPYFIATAGKYAHTDRVVRSKQYPHTHSLDNPALSTLPPTDRFKDGWDRHCVPQMRAFLSLLHRNQYQQKVLLQIHLPDPHESGGLHEQMPEPAYNPPTYGPPRSVAYTIPHRWLLHRCEDFTPSNVVLAWEVKKLYRLLEEDYPEWDWLESDSVPTAVTEVSQDDAAGEVTDLDLDEYRLGGWEVRREKRFVKKERKELTRNPSPAVWRYARYTLTRLGYDGAVLGLLPGISKEEDKKAEMVDQEVVCGTCERCKPYLDISVP